MKFTENQIYHIFNQGNNKERIFFQKRNYLFFLKKMRIHILPYVDFLCYCLMPNHFHWLVVAKAEACMPSKAVKPNPNSNTDLMASSHQIGSNHYQQNLSNAIAILLRSYTQAINKQEGRTGSLFRSKTKAKDGWIQVPITVGSKYEYLLFRPENNYARQCFNYIHENPVKANLVKNAEDWIYSSARDYAGLRNGTLCTKTKAQELGLY